MAFPPQLVDTHRSADNQPRRNESSRLHLLLRHFSAIHNIAVMGLLCSSVAIGCPLALSISTDENRPVRGVPAVQNHEILEIQGVSTVSTCSIPEYTSPKYSESSYSILQYTNPKYSEYTKYLKYFVVRKPEIFTEHEVPDIFFLSKYLTFLPGTVSICAMCGVLWYLCRCYITTDIVCCVSSRNNRHGRWVCRISTGRKNTRSIHSDEIP